MGAAEKFYLTIRNSSKSKTLVLADIQFKWGRVSDGGGPVKEVPPKSTVQVLIAQGRDNTSSGTEGWIKYDVKDTPGKWVQANWDVPWLSGKKNTCTLLSSADDASEDDPTGNVVWEPLTPLSSDGTSLSVIVEFGYVIEL
ncbi:hypothetical protein ID850_02460 [Xenorhabdus sp. Flor]|uniref:aegerolysin family protein n=1 Tax=Xenorhabdus cabanillasii TaxID=351673 RepID=UPI001983B179|nr:aegerolysin family protein [Xenorhabdus sp. Flor]MBD2813649.1 hypothetical protein [Xenorhabdus sp. Flor]